MTGERLVIGLPSKGFWACSKEEQVQLYQMSGKFQSNGLNFFTVESIIVWCMSTMTEKPLATIYVIFFLL